MANPLNTLTQGLEYLTLEAALQVFDRNEASLRQIPAIVRFFESPDSPLRQPGRMTQQQQHCLHILLGLGMQADDKAFVLGFSLGNDASSQWYHAQLFKWLVRFIYPSSHQFNQKQLKLFAAGFQYGRSLTIRNLNHFEFEIFYLGKIRSIRKFLGIDPTEIQRFWQQSETV